MEVLEAEHEYKETELDHSPARAKNLHVKRSSLNTMGESRQHPHKLSFLQLFKNVWQAVAALIFPSLTTE